MGVKASINVPTVKARINVPTVKAGEPFPSAPFPAGQLAIEEAATAAVVASTQEARGVIALQEGSTNAVLASTQEARGSIAAVEAATQALIQGSQEARGVVAAAAAATQCAMVSLMDQMVTDAQNAGFTVYASYDHRTNVRFDPDGVTVNGVDDERDSTSTGQLVFPAAGGVLCGNYAGLDGATKATFTFFFDVGAAPSGASTILSRLRNGTATGQFSIRFNSSTIELVMGNGAALVTQKTASAFATPGTVFKATLTIDLVAAVTHVYTQQYDVSAQAFGAETDRGMTGYPAFPVAFSTPVTTNLCIGGQVGSSNIGNAITPLADGSGILRARVRPGVILTTAQRAADTLVPNIGDPNWVAPDLAYEMQGGVTNTGLAGHTFDGALPSTAFLCSDDIRYGATLASGGTNRMSWSAANGFGTNGVNTFARAIGGLLATLPAATYRILTIGGPPSGVGVWVNTATIANVDQLALEATSVGHLDAIYHRAAGSSPTIIVAPGAGVRAVTGRAISTTQVGIVDGSAAEAVGTALAVTFGQPAVLTLFANGAATPGSFAPNGTIKKIMILKATTGTTAALQALVDSYGIAFFNASV